MKFLQVGQFAKSKGFLLYQINAYAFAHTKSVDTGYRMVSAMWPLVWWNGMKDRRRRGGGSGARVQ